MAQVYSRGMRGDEVAAIQSRLTLLGFYHGRLDGIFGPKTSAAVIEFQQRFLVNGIIDHHTARVLQWATDFQQERAQMLPFQPPRGLTEIIATFGDIEYEQADAGTVVITNDWGAKHIEKVDLPIVGVQNIHTKMALPFTTALGEIEAQGLAKEIQQFGCWSPRHKMHNPASGLSTHSWAIACDINWATNPVGRVGDMHPSIVEAFEAAGFSWGGRWRRRDDMHFQYARGY